MLALSNKKECGQFINMGLSAIKKVVKYYMIKNQEIFFRKEIRIMVLKNCTTCAVYGADDSVQGRVLVKCTGEQITLLLKGEHGLTDSENVRIDFYDSQIGCVKTNCKIVVGRNDDLSISAPWIADCEILEVIEIVEGRRSPRAAMENEALFTVPGQDTFSGIIQNISEGGIYFITRTRQQCDETINFSYAFIEKEHPIEAVILREEDLGDGRYGYGCQFMGFSEEALNDIRQYVDTRRKRIIW